MKNGANFENILPYPAPLPRKQIWGYAPGLM